jgi:hypothetical protein
MFPGSGTQFAHVMIPLCGKSTPFDGNNQQTGVEENIMKLFARHRQQSHSRSYFFQAGIPGQHILCVMLLLLAGATVFADEPILRVARISLLQGEASYQRAGSSRDNWFEATINTPLGENDQIYTGRDGRVEIQFTGRNLARLNRDTNLKVTQFTTGITQLALSTGTATFRIESLDRRQFEIVNANDANRDEPLYFEVDTPAVAITFTKEGTYRVNVLEDGTTEVSVRNGAAEVYNQTFGTIPVKKGRQMIIAGNDVEAWRVAKIDDKDEWDRWNDRRNDDLYARTELRSSRYVPNGVAGLYELDYYGDWYQTPDYGWVWSPRSTTVGWAPYRSGYWRHYGSYGWTWISYEPWGWAPYHYGRWAYFRNRWCWVPNGGFAVTYSSWSWQPSLCVFFGWGNNRGYRRGYRDGYYDGYRDGRFDNIGWVPLAPGERYNSRYGGRNVVNNNIIINNNINVNTEPRSLNELRNASIPGGLTNVEGRRFNESRVVVNANEPGTRTADINVVRNAQPIGRTVAFTPSQAEMPKGNQIVPETAARRIDAPVVRRIERETPSMSSGRSDNTLRSVERGMPTLRDIDRGVQATQPSAERQIERDAGNRGNAVRNTESRGAVTAPRSADSTATPRSTENPSLTIDRPVSTERRGGVSEVTAPRSSERSIERTDNSGIDRSRRAPDFRPAERPTPPTATTRRSASEDIWGRREESPRQIERSTPSRRVPDYSPRSEERSNDTPVWSAPRQQERREEPRYERRESPRQIERPVERSIERSSPPPQAERRSEPQRAPAAERNVERSSERSDSGRRSRPDND